MVTSTVMSVIMITTLTNTEKMTCMTMRSMQNKMR